MFLESLLHADPLAPEDGTALSVRVWQRKTTALGNVCPDFRQKRRGKKILPYLLILNCFPSKPTAEYGAQRRAPPDAPEILT